MIWFLIAAISFAIYRFADTTWGSIVAAVIAMILTWFTPGMFPRRVDPYP